MAVLDYEFHFGDVIDAIRVGACLVGWDFCVVGVMFIGGVHANNIVQFIGDVEPMLCLLEDMSDGVMV